MHKHYGGEQDEDGKGIEPSFLQEIVNERPEGLDELVQGYRDDRAKEKEALPTNLYQVLDPKSLIDDERKFKKIGVI
jgi:hypothetical protein